MGKPQGPARSPSAAPATDERFGAWRAFLFAQATLLSRLDAELQAESGLTLAEFDALVQLALTRDRRLRMSALADRVLLSRSGVTRLVDRLERDGWVTRETCAPDGRGAYAVLTEAGLGRVRTAMPRHLASVERQFVEPIGDADLAAIERGLARVAAANGRSVPSGPLSDEAIARLVGADEAATSA
jgi:DNA-binding MarR family transcriptional regulator